MVDEPYLVAALHRHVPDTRRFGQLRVIQLRTVGGFECFEASAFGDLHRSTTSRRDLPDLPITRSVRSKVDPAFISRPGRPSVVRDVVRDGAHATALGGNHIDVIGPRSVRIEGDQPPGGAPTGATHENGAERCQLHRLRTVAFGYPNLVTPRPQGDKHDPLAVGRELGSHVNKGGSDEPLGRAVSGRGLARLRSRHSPDVFIRRRTLINDASPVSSNGRSRGTYIG